MPVHSKPVANLIAVAVEASYVVRHPLNTYGKYIDRKRQRTIAEEIDRSAAKARHPSMRHKSHQERQQQARRDVERILDKQRDLHKRRPKGHK